MTQWRAIFFDLDGTLVETAGEIADAVNDTLAAWHLPAVSQKQVEDWIGHGTKTLLIQALAYVKGVSVEEIKESAFLSDVLPTFDHHYQARCGTRSQLYPHVRETLAHLREAGVKLAVVTNKEGRYTDTVLKAQQLDDAFDAVVSGDTFAVKKPNPHAVSELLTRWHIDSSAALFVGDSSIDAATAFDCILDELIVVKDNSGSIFLPSYSFNGIGNLIPGMGYQIKITDSISSFSFCD